MANVGSYTHRMIEDWDWDMISDMTGRDRYRVLLSQHMENHQVVYEMEHQESERLHEHLAQPGKYR